MFNAMDAIKGLILSYLTMFYPSISWFLYLNLVISIVFKNELMLYFDFRFIKSKGAKKDQRGVETKQNTKSQQKSRDSCREPSTLCHEKSSVSLYGQV